MLETNAASNASVTSPVSVRALRWGDEKAAAALCNPTPDLVVLSDCVYYEDAVTPLVETLKAVNAAEVLISYEERHSEQKKRVQKRFWAEVSERVFLAP